MDICSDVPIRRPFSLSGNDFYPLVQVRPGEMTYDQKVKYRARHGIPGTIDQWIELAKTHILAPTGYLDGHNHGPSLEYLLWQDDVECILKVIHKEGALEEPFQDPDEFTLMLRLCVPPTSGFLMFYWHSPIVVIDKYTGELRTHSHLIGFKPCRPSANERVMSRVTSWCKAMSIPVTGLSTFIRPQLYFDPISPRNTHRHKPQGSNLSPEEAQKLKEAFNNGSPLQRWK
ncbi:hypothetical protein CPB84DRAFT_1841011 [Gymnopilus junonius]|uniref:Uncharacterized protein n=1 Tax=Gymnopilus junonius TaxID=109634 RepID=A0A9P5P4N5_GYMJU|nr:hypothetical protein CPB84DRAFT_1841011 [Gymnopilus junonius]